MPESQVGYVLAAQVFDLGQRKPYITGDQLGADLLGGAMPPKQGISYEDQDIMGDAAATADESA
jgi:hypothetical protein